MAGVWILEHFTSVTSPDWFKEMRVDKASKHSLTPVLIAVGPRGQAGVKEGCEWAGAAVAAAAAAHRGHQGQSLQRVTS